MTHTHVFRPSFEGVLTCIICGLSREIPAADPSGVSARSGVAVLQAPPSASGQDMPGSAGPDHIGAGVPR